MMFRFWNLRCFAPDGPVGGAGANGDGGGSGAGSGAGSGSGSGAGGGATVSSPSGGSTSLTPSEISTGGSAAGRDDGDGGAAGGDPFAGFDLPFVGDEGLEGLVLETEAPPASTTASAPTPTPTPQPAATAPAATPPASNSPPQAASPQVGEALPTSIDDVTLDNIDALMSDPEMTQRAITAWSQQFQFTPEEVEKLTTEPEQVLPLFAAKILHAALRSVPAQIRRFVPSLVNSTVQRETAHSAHETAFFSMWPGLRGKDAGTIVQAIQLAAGQMRGQPLEKIMERAGTVAATLFGLDLSAVRGAQTPPVAGAGNGSGRPVAPPFRPPGANGRMHGSPDGGGVGAPPGGDKWGGFDSPPNSDR